MIQYIIENELYNLIENISSVDIIRGGKITSIDVNSKYFSTFRDKFVDKLNFARILPALAVSIHEDTVEAMKKGCWVQINFDSTKEINGLPFESLLVKVENANGFNLIRKFNNRYDGRCIYLYIDDMI